MNTLSFNDVKTTDYFQPGAPKAPFALYGGKAYYAEWIIDHFPEHNVYVEPFGGAANVLLRKKPSPVEIFNDLDGRLVNFFRVLRDPELFKGLQLQLSLTPYSRKEFEQVVSQPIPEDPVEQALWFFIRCRQARGGFGISDLGKGSWAMSTRPRRQMAEPVSKYLSAIDGLEAVAARFQTVAIECLPGPQVISKYDKEDVLFYCDPPYLPETRHGGKANTFAHEMTRYQHIQLLDALVKCRGWVILSGYESELYNEKLVGWRKDAKETKTQIANSGGTRVECLWMNW